MDKKFNFRNLICYQKGRALVKEVYALVKTFPVEEKYALIRFSHGRKDREFIIINEAGKKLEIKVL